MQALRLRPYRLLAALVSIPLFARALTAAPLRESSDTNVIRVACIGDDITRGAGLADPLHQSYPAQLAAMLGKRWKVETFAGDDVTMLSKGARPLFQQSFMPSALWSEADVFILMYGTHDSHLPNWEHAAQFVGDYRDLIGSFVDLSNKPRVWVCLPPPVYTNRADDFAWAARIEPELIPKIHAAAATRQTPEIDFFKPMQAHPELFIDGVHPNPAGARLMAEIAYRTLTGKSPPPP